MYWRGEKGFTNFANKPADLISRHFLSRVFINEGIFLQVSSRDEHLACWCTTISRSRLDKQGPFTFLRLCDGLLAPSRDTSKSGFPWSALGLEALEDCASDDSSGAFSAFSGKFTAVEGHVK
jgi:hypothetical protein